MDRRLEHLATLGLGPDASWDEVTQAYKDMMRVWHPDRFQTDERLRKKAEEHSQRINQAISELRKLGKDGFEKARRERHTNPNPASTHPSSSQQASSHRTHAHSSTHNAHSNSYRSSQASSRSSFTFEIAPLIVRAKAGACLIKLTASVAVLYLAYDSISRSLPNPQQEAFAMAIIFAAIDLGSRNFMHLFLSGPIVTVDRSGLVLPRTGRLNWADFDSVWPLVNPRFSTLSVTFSGRYIDKHPPVMRAFLKLRAWLNPAHVVIPFNGLTASPVEVVNAMKLFQQHHQMVLEDTKPKSYLPFFLIQIASLAACIIPLIRCFRENGLAQAEFTAYVAVFTACRVGDFICRRIRMRG